MCSLVSSLLKLFLRLGIGITGPISFSSLLIGCGRRGSLLRATRRSLSLDFHCAVRIVSLVLLLFTLPLPHLLQFCLIHSSYFLVHPILASCLT